MRSLPNSCMSKTVAQHHKADICHSAVVPLALTLYLYGQQSKQLMSEKTLALWDKALPVLYSLFSSEPHSLLDNTLHAFASSVCGSSNLQTLCGHFFCMIHWLPDCICQQSLLPFTKFMFASSTASKLKTGQTKSVSSDCLFMQVSLVPTQCYLQHHCASSL